MRVLITGMSGTGKSTVIQELKARGYAAVDADADGLAELVRTDAKDGVAGDLDWLWCEPRMQDLLDSHANAVLFVSGCAPNQGRFYAQFERVVLLSAPADVMVERLRTRTSNPYGKRAGELARTLELKHTIEPLLRRRADLEIDTSAPLAQVVEALLSVLGEP